MARLFRLLPFLLLFVLIGAGAAGWKLGYLSLRPEAAQAALQSDAAEPHEAMTKQVKRTSLRPGEGLLLSTKERVVNLADTNSLRYLKANIVLELQPEDGKPVVARGEAYKKAQEEFTQEMAPYLPGIEDSITSILASKTATELLTADGKNALKTELRDRINQLLEQDRVIAVYLTQFIIQ